MKLRAVIAAGVVVAVIGVPVGPASADDGVILVSDDRAVTLADGDGGNLVAGVVLLNGSAGRPGVSATPPDGSEQGCRIAVDPAALQPYQQQQVELTFIGCPDRLLRHSGHRRSPYRQAGIGADSPRGAGLLGRVCRPGGAGISMRQNLDSGEERPPDPAAEAKANADWLKKHGKPAEPEETPGEQGPAPLPVVPLDVTIPAMSLSDYYNNRPSAIL